MSMYEVALMQAVVLIRDYCKTPTEGLKECEHCIFNADGECILEAKPKHWKI